MKGRKESRATLLTKRSVKAEIDKVEWKRADKRQGTLYLKQVPDYQNFQKEDNIALYLDPDPHIAAETYTITNVIGPTKYEIQLDTNKRKLYRVCSEIEAYFTKKNRCVGGIIREIRKNSLCPTNSEAVNQVANHETYGQKLGIIQAENKTRHTTIDYQRWEEANKSTKVKEYSDRPATQFQGTVIHVSLDMRYLIKGSNLESEQGWVAYIGAPLTILDGNGMSVIQEEEEENEDD